MHLRMAVFSTTPDDAAIVHGNHVEASICLDLDGSSMRRDCRNHRNKKLQ